VRSWKALPAAQSGIQAQSGRETPVVGLLFGGSGLSRRGSVCMTRRLIRRVPDCTLVALIV
jgi:hypothetical protein